MKITIENNDDGFLAKCPGIDGAFAEGDTEFEALYNLFDVIRMINDYNKSEVKRGKERSFSFNIPITV